MLFSAHSWYPRQFPKQNPFHSAVKPYFFRLRRFFCLVQSPSAIFIPFQLFGTNVKKSVVLSNSTQPQDRTLSATLDSRPPRVPLFITRAGNVIICGSYLIRSEFRISHLVTYNKVWSWLLHRRPHVHVHVPVGVFNHVGGLQSDKHQVTITKYSF